MGSHEIVLFGGKNRKEMRCVALDTYCKWPKICNRFVRSYVQAMQVAKLCLSRFVKGHFKIKHVQDSLLLLCIWFLLVTHTICLTI